MPAASEEQIRELFKLSTEAIKNNLHGSVG